jgi:hypothetical protein
MRIFIAADYSQCRIMQQVGFPTKKVMRLYIPQLPSVDGVTALLTTCGMRAAGTAHFKKIYIDRWRQKSMLPSQNFFRVHRTHLEQNPNRVQFCSAVRIEKLPVLDRSGFCSPRRVLGYFGDMFLYWEWCGRVGCLLMVVVLSIAALIGYFSARRRSHRASKNEDSKK